MIPIILTCGPNEVIVVSGLGYKKPALVTGGRIIVFPLFQTWKRLYLNVMTLEISSPGVYTLQGVPIKVTGVAQVKIASTPCELLEAACENFLSKSTQEIMIMIRETLEGHQRGIMGSMTVEDIYKNRKLFSERVFDVASKDLLNFGVTVLSYTIKDVTDDIGYLAVLGKKRTAEVMKDARIGEAHARMDSRIRESMANEQLAEEKYKNATSIAEAERTYTIQKANYDCEVNTQKAVADYAYELQSHKVKQKIKDQEMEIKVVERAKRIEIEEEELKRKAKELEATVNQPAIAEKYRMETLAEAARKKAVLEAEARSEAIRMKAEAEAQATLAMANAEAEQMTNKAKAWEEYGEAAILHQFLQTLPKVARQVSLPLSRVKGVKMISSGDSDIGAAKLAKEVSDITTGIPDIVQKMTGIELKSKMNSIQRRPVVSVRH